MSKITHQAPSYKARGLFYSTNIKFTEVVMMKIEIEGTPKEIAELALELQNRLAESWGVKHQPPCQECGWNSAGAALLRDLERREREYVNNPQPHSI